MKKELEKMPLRDLKRSDVLAYLKRLKGDLITVYKYLHEEKIMGYLPTTG